MKDAEIAGAETWVQMEVRGLLLDPTAETPVLLLQSAAGQLLLPIWIGPVEANAIAMALEGVRAPRPMTHDLIEGILSGLEADLERIEIWQLLEGTFHGRLRLRKGESTIEVDSRPSDAVAIAVRLGAPIWVAKAVIEEALRHDLASTGDEEQLRDWLEKVRPEDLGKYTM